MLNTLKTLAQMWFVCNFWGFHVINNDDSQVQEQSDAPSKFLSTHLQILSLGLFQLDKCSKILFIGPQVTLV